MTFYLMTWICLGIQIKRDFYLLTEKHPCVLDMQTLKYFGGKCDMKLYEIPNDVKVLYLGVVREDVFNKNRLISVLNAVHC